MNCIICGSGGELLPHRGKPNRKCPNCGSLARQRNLYKYLQDNNLIENKTILHIAPEQCLKNIISLKSKYCVFADKNNHFNKPFLSKLDITDLSILNKNSFDLAICFHVLEHILDDIKAIIEIKKVLKPSGLLFLSVPIDGESTYIWTDEHIESKKKDGTWGLPGRYGGHYRTYGLSDLDKILKEHFGSVVNSSQTMTSEDFFICEKTNKIF